MLTLTNLIICSYLPVSTVSQLNSTQTESDRAGASQTSIANNVCSGHCLQIICLHSNSQSFSVSAMLKNIESCAENVLRIFISLWIILCIYIGAAHSDVSIIIFIVLFCQTPQSRLLQPSFIFQQNVFLTGDKNTFVLRQHNYRSCLSIH